MTTKLVIAIAAAGCAASPPPTQSPRIDAFAASLDAYYTRAFPAEQPGGAVLVMKRGEVVFAKGYGLADLDTRERVTTRTLFNVGSISKTFVANAILILQQRGKLSVDDSLGTFFPELASADIASRVKLRHLLTHTSGLPDNRDVANHWDFFLTAKDAENWHPVTQATALEFEPGTKFEYSNPSFNGLALIVEKLAGMKWQRFVHDEIFIPAGMATSTITDGPHPASGVAHGYEDALMGWAEADYGEVPTFAAAGNGGVWSSVDELAAYERALQAARFLPASAIADSRTVKTFPGWQGDEPPGIGWSWFVVDEPGKPRRIGHTGSQGGFRATYQTLPDKQLFYVVLSNSDHDGDAYGPEILRQLERAGWLE